MRRARRGGREVSFVVLVHQDHEKEKRRKARGVRFRHPRLSFAHLRLAQLRVRHEGTLSAEGIFPRSRSAGSSATPYTRGDLIVVRDSVLVQERAPRHRAVPRAPSGRTKINGSRFCGRRGDPTASPRTFADALSSRGRFRGATRFRRLAREASTAARSPVSAGDSARARRRRARSSVLTRFRGGWENASPQRNLPISARIICARSSLYGRCSPDSVSRASGGEFELGLIIRVATFGITDRLACRQFFPFSPALRSGVSAHAGEFLARQPASRLPRLKDPRSARAFPLDAARCRHGGFPPRDGVGQVASAKVHPVVVFNICDRYAARRDRPTLRARVHRRCHAMATPRPGSNARRISARL